MASVNSAQTHGRTAGAPDVADLLKTTVTDVLCLERNAFDPEASLGELGCDSLDAMDILYRMEIQLDVPGDLLREPLDFNPLNEPLTRLEQHLRSALPSV